MEEGVMGVGGVVVRLFFKLPHGDLTDNYWVNERGRWSIFPLRSIFFTNNLINTVQI